MNEKIIFIRTSSGEDEVRSRTAHLSKDIKRALLMVDGTATVAEIMKRSSPSLRGMLEDMFTELARGGFIRDKAKAVSAAKPILIPEPPEKNDKSSGEVDFLDFTAAYRAPTAEMMAEEGAKLERAAAAKARADAEVAEVKARAVAAEKSRLISDSGKFKAIQEAERLAHEAAEVARIKAAQETAARSEAEARVREQAAQLIKAEQLAAEVKAEAAANARLAADAQAKLATAAAELKAQQDIELARVKAEQEAARSKAEDQARAATEAKIRLETEVAKLKAQADADARARVVADAQARMEAEEAKLRAQQIAESARIKAEQEAAKALADAEARAREQAELHAKAALDAARIKAEQHAAEVKAEAEQHAAAVKAEAEARALAAAEERAKLEAELIEIKAQAERDARIRAEAEQKARLAADAARLDAERTARENAERIKAEQEAARLEQEARAREERERHEQAAAEAARQAAQHAAEIKAEAEARARLVAEEHAKLEAEVAKLKAKAEADAQARIEAEENAKQEAKAARIKAEQAAKQILEEVQLAKQRAAVEALAREQAEHIARDAEMARVQAEQEAERIKARAEAQALAAEQAVLAVEAAKLQAQQEIDRLIQEAEETARIKALEAIAQAEADAENRARAEKEAEMAAKDAHDEVLREQATQQALEAEEAIKAEQAAVMYKMNSAEPVPRTGAETQTNSAMLASIVRLNAKHAAMENSVFAALDELAQQAEDDSTPLDTGVAPQDAIPNAGSTAPLEKRTTTATVAFFDIVGYSKQPGATQIDLKHQLSQLVTNSIDPLNAGERIVLDTGDGVAIGFMQHPTDALESAMHFRTRLMANKHADYPELRVRIGIHLGPVSLVKDLNGKVNLLGDGINSAQRVMSFAGTDQIYVSRAYFEFLASLSDEYGELFRYRGSQQDKHGREFQVYELLDADVDVNTLPQAQEPAPQSEPIVKLDGFNFDAFDALLTAEKPAAQTVTPPQSDIAGQLLKDSISFEPVEAVVPEALHIEPSDYHAAMLPEVVRTSSATPPQQDAKQRFLLEIEAKNLANAQARKWEEAEERSLELARKSAEIAAQRAAMKPVEEKPVSKIRKRRKPIPWVKVGAGAALLLVTSLFVAPYLLPTQNYASRIEQSLTEKWHQPVHIGNLAVRILPTPQLLLSEVSIGESRQVKLNQAQLNFSFVALLGGKRSINSIEIDGAQLKGSSVPQLADWLQPVGSDAQYPVARIVLRKVQLDADGIVLPALDGELTFDPAGKFSKVSLSDSSHKLAAEINSTAEQKLALTLTLRDSALPLLPNWQFEEFKATGELSRDEWHITDMDSRIKGGILTGDARINWRSGWRVQGTLVAKVIPLQNINKLLTGDLDGSARYQMQADSLAKLTDMAILNGVFNVQKGMINSMDVITTAHLHSRESLPGGRTHFDELSGELSYANGRYQFSQLKLSGSVLKAAGAVTVVGQQLSGNISADLSMRAGMGRASLQVGGTTESPTLKAAR